MQVIEYVIAAIALGWLLLIAVALAKVIRHRDDPPARWRAFLTAALSIQGALALLVGFPFLTCFGIGLLNGASLTRSPDAFYGVVFGSYGIGGTLFGLLSLLGATKLTRLSEGTRNTPAARETEPPAV